MKVSDYQDFFDVPVAVQLRQPSMIVDNDGEPRNRMQHGNREYGVPQPVVMQGNPAAQLMLVGVLVPSKSEELLTFRSKGERGAVIVTTLLPDQIQHVFVIERPGDGIPLITSPGN